MSADFYRMNSLNNNFASKLKGNISSFVTWWTSWICLPSVKMGKMDWSPLWAPWIYRFQWWFMADECRPYASTSSRYKTFSNQYLQFDPLGFYSPRLISDNRPRQELPFFEDYPQNDHGWLIYEPNPLSIKKKYL